MPEPTLASKRHVLQATDRVHNGTSDDDDDDDICSGSEDMESELRIVDAASSDVRSISEPEVDQSSNDNDSTPQDLRVLRGPSPALPITLASSEGSPKLSPAKALSPSQRAPELPASRKRKSTTPTQDRRAKWLLAGCGSPPLAPPPPPLSPAVNGRGPRPLDESEANFPLLPPGSENATPLMSPTAQTAVDVDGSTEADEDEEVMALRQEIGRYEEQLRTEFAEASERFCKHVESSVRHAVTAIQARHLASLSATATAAAAAAASSQVTGPLPPLSDINGNPALFNMKEVSKNMEQFMLASQCLPYRFIAAAAAAANSGRLPQPQLPYPPPISGPGGTPSLLSPLLPPPGPPMPLAFPLAASGPCDSPGGTAGDSDDFETDGMPLNMSKKKRTKVTDNHLRAFTGLDMSAVLPAALENLGVFNNISAVSVAASVAQPPPPLTSTPSVSLTSTPLRGPSSSFTDLSSTTLTPVHLRKAKLMFFYTRYPNSNVLKVYFPDVQFNKHNTAQIVKWFSNFREFYYIQIEKFARQAIAEGVQEADEITIVAESELIRTLNTHYNRNNQIPVPHHFITVVEVTVREFFKALICHKDQDHSWKKPIYKVIARYDQPVPDDFKAPTWIDQMDT